MRESDTALGVQQGSNSTPFRCHQNLPDDGASLVPKLVDAVHGKSRRTDSEPDGG